MEACKSAELPEPEMKEQDGGFLITVFKDRFTEEQLKQQGLNGRQVKAVAFVNAHRSITNSTYQEINQVGKTTASEELQQLIDKEIVRQAGSKGRGSKYELAR